MRLIRATTLIHKVRRRVAGLPAHRQAYYALNAMIGEALRRRTIGTLGLRLVGIDLTECCQCRCVHCYDAKAHSKRASLSAGEVRSILDQAAAMHATEISFSGGEPLLHPDLVSLVSYAHQKGLSTKVNTNGIGLSAALIRALRAAGLNWCAVSIDSVAADEHDALRGYPGCHERAV
jgi:MoaA/NifB/PqqE/SkfB family radical SAM enzyme